MKTPATSAALFAAPADAETQRRRTKPRGTLPERAPIKKRGAAPPPRENKEQSPQLKCRCSNGAGRSRRRALFEPTPATKPKRRRAAKARDVSDDLELRSAATSRTFLEARRACGRRARRAARASAAPAEAAAAAPRVGGGRGLSAGGARRAPWKRVSARAAADRASTRRARALRATSHRQRLPEDFRAGRAASAIPNNKGLTRQQALGRLGGKCAGPDGENKFAVEVAADGRSRQRGRASSR